MNGISFNRLRYFFEAVRLKSVRGAADYLNVAPSAVSRQISQLELELNSQLIERHRRGVRPTEAGDRVLAFYQHHLGEQELLIDSLQALRGLQSGSLTLAIGEGYIESISGILSDFSAHYPAIRINIEICGSNDVIRLIVEDEAHIGILYNPSRDTKLRTHQSYTHPLCVITNPEHPLALQAKAVEIQSLGEHRLALTRVSHGIRQIVSRVEEDTGITLEPAVVCNNLLLLKNYAKEGGVSLLPDFMVRDEVRAGSLVAIPLHHRLFAFTETQIVTRLGRQHGSGVNKLLQKITGNLFKEQKAS
ncbi:LysR family transcriptional regulator [Erwinia sp. E_sp_B04_7]|uniref:LysR family transcriptional regulator n=1 Tax=unclassified Erwinia TaxID=2622719 RepID=UPI0030D48063